MSRLVVLCGCHQRDVTEKVVIPEHKQKVTIRNIQVSLFKFIIFVLLSLLFQLSLT